MKALRLPSFVEIVAGCVFGTSLGVSVGYANYLAVYRPDHRVLAQAYAYPFPGKGNIVYVSAGEWAFAVGAFAVFIASIFWLDRLNRKTP